MENPIKMDDLGVPLFSETSRCKDHENISFIVSVLNVLGEPTHFT